jgi:hypothetical protein
MIQLEVLAKQLRLCNKAPKYISVRNRCTMLGIKVQSVKSDDSRIVEHYISDADAAKLKAFWDKKHHSPCSTHSALKNRGAWRAYYAERQRFCRAKRKAELEAKLLLRSKGQK